MSTASRKVVRRDRQWLDAPTVGICGPFDMPSADAIADAAAAVAQRHPHSRFAWTLDETRSRWRTGDAVPPVVERTGDHDLDDYVTGLARDTALPAPLVFVRSRNYLALKISHAVGDGTYFNRALSAVLATAQTGQVPDWPANTFSGRFPLGAAVVRTFGRHPGLLRHALADRSTGAEHGPRVVATPNVQRRTGIVTLPADVAGEVVARGREQHPGVSTFGLHAALVLRGLAESGIAVDANVLVLHDLRRYYRSPDLDGNFVVGVPARFDPATGPSGFTSTVRRTSASGRPLLTQLATSLRGASTEPSTAQVAAISSLGAPPSMSALQYKGGSTPMYTGSLHPAGPGGITALIAEVQGAVTISMSYYEPSVDPRRIAGALGVIASDPVGVVGTQ